MALRRRYTKEVSNSSLPVALVDKGTESTTPVTTTLQTATTTFINETGKETKVATYTEQTSGSTGVGDFSSMPTVNNGNITPSHVNGILANGNKDQSELHLLQHEDH